MARLMKVLLLKLRNRKVRHFLALALLLLAAAASLSHAEAHSFNTVLIVSPDTDPAAERGIVQSFLLASEETDQHADQTSDGHLGGLDVYLTVVRGPDWDAVAAADPQFIVISPGTDVTAAPGTVSAVLVHPVPIGDPRAQGVLSLPADTALPPFSERFRARTGRLPAMQEQATYIAARRIDLAVRAQGSADDLEELGAAIAQWR